MKRALALTLLLATMLAAACGESDTGHSQRSAPTEPQQTETESTPESVQKETTQGRVPAEDEAAKSGQEGDEPSGLSIRTIEGEKVKLGGRGDVTALFFMAGW